MMAARVSRRGPAETVALHCRHQALMRLLMLRVRALGLRLHARQAVVGATGASCIWVWVGNAVALTRSPSSDSPLDRGGPHSHAADPAPSDRPPDMSRCCSVHMHQSFSSLLFGLAAINKWVYPRNISPLTPRVPITLGGMDRHIRIDNRDLPLHMTAKKLACVVSQRRRAIDDAGPGEAAC